MHTFSTRAVCCLTQQPTPHSYSWEQLASSRLRQARGLVRGGWFMAWKCHVTRAHAQN